MSRVKKVRDPDILFADCVKVPRVEAVKMGQRVYWTGFPCDNGHTTWRRTSDKRCVQCIRGSQHRKKMRRELGRYGTMGFGAKYQELAQELRELKQQLDDWEELE